MSTQPLHVNGWSCHRLVNEGFTFNKDGEWVKGDWSILLHDDYVTVAHKDWTNAGMGVEAVSDINEAMEVVGAGTGEWLK